MTIADSRVVGWMTPGGDMSKSRVWCDERCMPPAEPIPLTTLSLLAEAERERDAWKEFAQHQEHCAVCADAVSDCIDGTNLRSAAIGCATTGEMK